MPRLQVPRRPCVRLMHPRPKTSNRPKRIKGRIRGIRAGLSNPGRNEHSDRAKICKHLTISLARVFGSWGPSRRYRDCALSLWGVPKNARNSLVDISEDGEGRSRSPWFMAPIPVQSGGIVLNSPPPSPWEEQYYQKVPSLGILTRHVMSWTEKERGNPKKKNGTKHLLVLQRREDSFVL